MSATAIIIPCYNEGKRLNKEVFLSFLANNKTYHLFFVDDGSTDNTFKVLTEFEAKNSSQITIINWIMAICFGFTIILFFDAIKYWKGSLLKITDA